MNDMFRTGSGDGVTALRALTILDARNLGLRYAPALVHAGLSALTTIFRGFNPAGSWLKSGRDVGLVEGQ